MTGGRPHRPRLALAGAVCAVLLGAGCGAGYLAHVSWGQAGILWAREPIDDLLADQALDPEVRAKLQAVEDARRFARRLGLTPGDSYRSYVALDREWTSLALSAARKDALEAHLFHFPVVGSLPYKGYFDLERARADQGELEAEGLDTYLRPVDAYSTLGWFDDPVLSPMLDRPVVSLVDTILHEATHATVYWPRDVDLSEGFASFVGWEGAHLWAVERFGADAPEVREAEERRAARRQLVAFLGELFADLDAYYGDPTTTPEQKVAGREARFARWKERIARDVLEDGASYGWLAEREWNNAFLLSLRRYLMDVGDIERLHAALGSDLRRTIEVFLGWADDPDPSARVTERISEVSSRDSETGI